MIEFVGKTLLIDKKVLVIGDLHLGYGETLRKSGFMVPTTVYQTIFEELQAIFSRTGKVETIVILGDLKHAIGTILYEERKEINAIVSLCHSYAQNVVVVKGNHDVLLEPLVREMEIMLVDYYQWESYVFIHGDRDFEVLYEKDVKTWIMGHFHPALALQEGIKIEKYKCFLQGMYKKKEVIIVPSFFPGNEGTDVREQMVRSPWSFVFDKFRVHVVAEPHALDFGLLGNL